MIEPDTPLAEIAWALDQSGIPVDLQRGDEIVPFERLQILLLTDEKDRDFVVQVMFVDDLVDNMPLTAEVLGEDLDDELLDEEDDDDAVILLFSTILPYRAKPSSAGDLARLLMVVNRLLPIGAFGYIERDQGLYLAYPLTLLSRDALEGRVLEGVINRLIFAIESYNGLIEAVATGSKSADDVFAEIEEMGMPLPPLGEPHVMKQRRLGRSAGGHVTMHERDTVNSLLGNLCMKLGIANLMLSGQGTCAFDYKDELEITIELPDASEQIYIYAVVTEIPKKGQKKLFRKLLRLNLFCFETNGATFAIHEEHNCVLLCYQHAVQALDQNAFETILENFLTTLERLHENVHSEQYVDEHELAADDRIDPTRFIRA